MKHPTKALWQDPRQVDLSSVVFSDEEVHHLTGAHVEKRRKLMSNKNELFETCIYIQGVFSRCFLEPVLNRSVSETPDFFGMML